MTKKYYLQVEAVNLDAFVYDTNDISTIRGGSHVLRHAIERELAQRLKAKGFTPIATAASLGLFSFEAEEDVDAVRRRVVADVLGQLDALTDHHATFQAAVVPDSGDFRQVTQQLRTQIRRQQWRTPTVRPPEFEPTEQEGYLDGWRPGVVPYRVDPDVRGAKISRATAFRREQGRRIKHGLFQEVGEGLVEDDQAWLAAKDLSRLASLPEKGILHGKIAYLHIDGNGFGAIRHETCQTPELRAAFDHTIQERVRNAFLKALLAQARHDPDFLAQDAEGRTALRMEVLLWGGDEMTLVVPAWKGLEVLERFYRQAQGVSFQGIPLTYRAALIFAHHNAPILLLNRLADALLARTKKDIQPLREKNAAHYLVLESFDMLGSSLDRFIAGYYDETHHPVYPKLLLPASELPALKKHLHTVVRYASKGRVLDVIRRLRAGGDVDAADLASFMLATVDPAHQARVQDAIDRIIGDVPERWYLIADLWDYAKEWNG